MLRLVPLARRAVAGRPAGCQRLGCASRLSSRPQWAAAAVAAPGEGDAVPGGGAAAAAAEGLPYTFEAFHVQNKKSDVYAVQEGGYVDLEPKELDQFFPEGLAGEMDAEFEFSGRKSWMVRDSSKLLCRILDEFASKGKQGAKQAQQPAVHKGVVVPSLTDRPEWVNSSMRVQYFGQELLPQPQETIAVPKSKKTKRTAVSNTGVKVVSTGGADGTGAATGAVPHLSVVSGEGSVVDSCLSKLRAAAKDDKAVPSKILLTGPRGVGKSAVLNQMVLHARKTGWLCLFIPKGWDQVQSGWFVEPVPSSSGSAVLDNPFMSAQVLRGFWKAHAAQLRTMPLQFPGEMAKYAAPMAKFKEAYDRARSVPGREKMSFRQVREIVDAEDYFAEQDRLDSSVLDGSHFDLARLMAGPRTLEDLALLGVAFRDQAGLAVMDLVAELKKVKSVPVLVAIDQYNTWEATSAFHYRNEPVAGKQLCVPHSLSFLSKRKPETEAWKLDNGLCVCATSHAHAEGRHETYESAISSVPLVVRVPAYSQVEFLSAVSFYTHQNLVPKSGTSVQDLLAFRMMAGSNPFITRKEAVPFFFPLSVGKLGDDIGALTSGGDWSGGDDYSGGDVDDADDREV